MKPVPGAALRLLIYLLLFLIPTCIFSQDTPAIIVQHSTGAGNNRIANPVFKDARIIRFSPDNIKAFSKPVTSTSKLVQWSIDEDLQWSIQLKKSPVNTSGLAISGISAGRNSAATLPELFAGTMENGKGNVRLTVNNNFVYGFIDNGETRFFIEPLKKFDNTAASDEYLVYDVRTIPGSENFCGTDSTLLSSIGRKLPDTSAISARRTCIQLRMAIAVDYSVYKRYGSVETVVNYILANWNVVQSYYTGFDTDNESTTDVGDDDINFIITNLYIATDPNNDVVPDNGLTLKKFGLWGLQHFPQRYDISELITARNIPAPIKVAGIAGGGFGNNILAPVHILLDFFSNAYNNSIVTAHETGHNLGCGHDNDVHPSVRTFIMNYGLVQGTTRFSVNTDFPVGYQLSSKQYVKETFSRLQGSIGMACGLNPCEQVKGLEIQPVNTTSVRLHWLPTGTAYIVQYKLTSDSEYLASHTFEITDTEIAISELQACTKYDFLVKNKCNASAESLPVIISYQGSRFKADEVTLKHFDNRRYDLQFKLHYLNGNAETLSMEAIAGDAKQSFSFKGPSQTITIPGIYWDGQLLKHLKVNVAGYTDCTLDIPYTVPAWSNANCQTIFAADFNECKTPAGWSNKIIRRYFGNQLTELHIGPNDFTKNSALSDFPFGNIDGTCMPYFDFVNNGHIGQLGAYEIKSPVVDITHKANVTLSFDYAYFRNPARTATTLSFLKVEVFDGAQWVKVFMIDSSAQYVNHSGRYDFWSSVPGRVSINVDRYRNPLFQARFIIDDGSQVYFPAYGMLLAAYDNIALCGMDICPEPVDKLIPRQNGKAHNTSALSFCTDSSYFIHCLSTGDSLLFSFKKGFTNDSLELYPSQVQLHFFSSQPGVNASYAPYVKNNGRWVLLNKYWEVTPASIFSDSSIVRIYFTQAELEALCYAAGTAVNIDIIRPYYLINSNNAFSGLVHQNVQESNIVFPYSSVTKRDNYYVAEFVLKTPGLLGLGVSPDGELSATRQVTELTGVLKKEKIALQWKINEESEVEKYIVERSGDGLAFSAIGSVTGNGGGHYSFDDMNPAPGMNYYRVRILDHQGKYVFTKTIFFRFSKGIIKPVFIYPNPVTTDLVIEINSEQSIPVELEVQNAVGQVIWKTMLPVSVGFNRKTIPVRSLSPGVYLLRCHIGNTFHTMRFVKL